MAPDTPETIDKFQILQFLGEGGMGRLYLGRDPDIGRLVAIKLLREGYDTEEFRQRFVREAQSASALRHANIVTIFQTGTHNRQPFIVMEYIQGETLADLIARRRPLPLARKLRLIDEIAIGLQYAHRKGVIHRDIKPANIMLDEDGVLRILDFGIARVGGGGLTQSGVIIGTLNYMAPEQLVGVPVDARADIFSAGAVFYELLSHQRAFPGGFPDILQKILAEPPEPLEQLQPGLGADLIALVNRCLAKRPEERYQDFGAVHEALAAVRRDVADTTAETTIMVPALRKGRDDPRPVRSNEIRRRVDEARRALEEINYSRALEACQSALVLDPECAEALDLEHRARAALQQQQFVNRWLADARSALERGDATAASVLVDRALSVSSESTEALAIRRAVDETRQRWADAQSANVPVGQARAGLAATGDHAGAAAPSAGVARSLLRWRVAAAAVVLMAMGAAAVWQLPRDASAPPLPDAERSPASTGVDSSAVATQVAGLRSAAREAWQQGQLEIAMSNVAAALALEPDDAETRSLIADFVGRARERSVRAAAEARASGAARTPAHAAAVARESDAIRLQELGQAIDAARAFVEAAGLFAVAAGPGTPAVQPRAEPTVAPAARSASPAPDRIATLLAQAEALRLRRDYDAAIAQYTEVLKLAPQNEEARAALQETQIARQRAEEALAKLGGSATPPPATPEAEAQRLVEAAIKAMDAGDDATAQKALDEALRLDPLNTGAQKLLKVLTGR